MNVFISISHVGRRATKCLKKNLISRNLYKNPRNHIHYKHIKSNVRTLQQTRCRATISVQWDIRWFPPPLFILLPIFCKEYNVLLLSENLKYRTSFLSALQSPAPWCTCSMPRTAASSSPFYRWAGWASGRLSHLPRDTHPRHDRLEWTQVSWPQPTAIFPFASICSCFIQGWRCLQSWGESTQKARLWGTSIVSFKLSKGHLPGGKEAVGESKGPVHCVLARAPRPYWQWSEHGQKAFRPVLGKSWGAP